MRRNPTKKVERYRVTEGLLATSQADGANGAFVIPGPQGTLQLIVSDGGDWEHVSVVSGDSSQYSSPGRCPTWSEMDYVKRIFWRDDERVMQLHVPRSSHINVHPNCLHLWKPLKADIPRPPEMFV